MLNCIGYVVLVALFWLAFRRVHGWRWGMNVPLIVYVAVVFLGWVDFGMPNPLGLGYLSKAIEIVLMIALLAQTWRLLRVRPARRDPSGT